MSTKYWIQTFTGQALDFLNPTVEMVNIRDIGQSLARTSRYNGHTKWVYSVAQHSVYVSRLCAPRHKLVGLLHDAVEAYTGDLVAPFKRLPGGLEGKVMEVEERLGHVVAEKFGLPKRIPKEVKKADLQMLATEKEQLMGPLEEAWIEKGYTWTLPYAPVDIVIEKWDEDKSYWEFMKEYQRLTMLEREEMRR